MADFEVKDSGERQRFDSGMVRDTQTGKIDYWRGLIGPMFERLCVHVTKACAKYPDIRPGVPNWTLAAGDEERMRFKASAVRHFIQWFEGAEDEDHAAAVFFNINGYEYVKERQTKEMTNGCVERALPPVDREIPAHELPTTALTHELVQVGRGVHQMPTPEEVLKRIRQIDGWSNR